MTDEHGMLRNGSIESVGTAGRELNIDSTTPSSSAIASATNSNSVNTNLPNNDGNNNENATTQNNNSNNDRQSQSHSPIDTENGNNADHFVSGGCASNGNYSTTTGNGSNANSKQPNHSTNYSNSNNGSPLHNPCGGRLQFFKDGKFILELARSKEGDRGWISVPRKTYWPPAALSQNNLNNHKNESSTSLSFSDDNSSIQSSPWQRDHSWKQPSPRKCISKDLNLYYYRPMAIILSETSMQVSKHLRRQPHGRRNHVNAVQYARRIVSKAPLPKVDEKNGSEYQSDKDKLSETKENDNKSKDGDDIVDSPSIKIESKSNDNDNDDEQMDYKVGDENNTKLDETIAKNEIKVENCARIKVESIDKRKRQLLRTSKISNVIEKLIARVSDKPMNVTTTQTGLGIHFSASSRPNELFFPNQHVSPRKRILREFQNVSLEDRNSSTQKRSRSKSNASTDYSAAGNSKAAGANYSVVVAQHTASIACNNKEENNRVINGSPPRSANSTDVAEKPFKSSRSAAASATKNSHTHASSESSTQPASKPISNYSIISLLGHNNTSNNADSRNEANVEDRAHAENRGSPRSPMSYNQISRSPFVPKKKSPTTNNANALVNSPTNYRNARSPDINSPSPGLQQNSHHNRYHPASLSSPTSSFHPYLSSSRASPLSSGTLSPTDLYRHRSYRTAGSPSTMSNSSVGGLPHQYASLNGSPTTFAASNRYSPSTYSSSTKTSPTQSSQSHSLSSSAYNVSNLLPQAFDVNTSGMSDNNHRYSPNAKHRSSDWSPARNSTTSGRSSPSNYANSSNSLSTTTIPKKTASIRQIYGSLSPNGFACGNSNENPSSSSSSKSDPNPAKKYASDPNADAKHLAKRSKTPDNSHKKPPQPQELYEKDLHARYNAEVAAMHHQSLIASALQQQAASPFYHMYAGSNLHGANLPPPMAAAAAYMNPLYYHHPANEMFRKTHPSAAMDLLHKNLVPSWIDPYNAPLMHYPSMPSGSVPLSEKASLAAKSQNEAHSMLMSPYNLGRSVPGRDQPTSADIEMWNAADAKKSTITSSPASVVTSAFRRQSQQFNDCEPISLIKDEPSSDVPLNLSKH